jgi:hypothetical protein
MTCQNPLTDAQLDAVIDGVAEPDVVVHLAECAYCRARLEALQAFDQELMRMLRGQICPPSALLADYEAGRLGDVTALALHMHVSQCVRCQEELVTLRAFLETDDRFEPAAAAPVARQNRTSAPMLTPSEDVLVAQPSTDVVAYSAPANYREVAGAIFEPREDQAEIDLESHPFHVVEDITVFLKLKQGEGNRWMVTGQIITTDRAFWADALVQLTQPSQVPTVSAVGPDGGFRCRLPVREPFDLVITARKGTKLVMNAVKPGGNP